MTVYHRFLATFAYLILGRRGLKKICLDSSRLWEYCSSRRRRRTMSMQMIGRRSISVRSEFSCGSRCWGRGLCRHLPLPPFTPLGRQKGAGCRLTMARWHYVCRRRTLLFSNSLHSAFAIPQHATLLFCILFQLYTYHSVSRLASLVCGNRPHRSAICNRQFDCPSSPRLPLFIVQVRSRASIAGEHYCEHASSRFNPYENQNFEFLMSKFYRLLLFASWFYISSSIRMMIILHYPRQWQFWFKTKSNLN